LTIVCLRVVGLIPIGNCDDPLVEEVIPWV